MKTITHQETDKDLIEACQSGSKDAFEQLTHRYYEKAFGIAMVHLGNRDVALDISQEAFVRIYRNIAKLDADRPFGAWLYTITRNLCRNYVERQRKRRLVFSDFFAGNQHKLAEIPQESSDDLEQMERKRQLWDGLNQLSEADREIIVLKDFEDFSYKEIAEILGIPNGSVMSRLYYARKRLAKAVLQAAAAE